MPLAIAPAADEDTDTDEWAVISDIGSVFDGDYPSFLETETEAESLPETVDTELTERSFALINFSDEDTVGANSSAEEERPLAASDRRQRATPRPSSPSSSATAQPHEFGKFTKH